MTRIYVGNLSRETTETELGAALTAGGRTVAKVMLKRDGDSGVSRGFAFVDWAVLKRPPVRSRR